MKNDKNQNPLISALVLWIDNYNLDFKKYVFSRFKLRNVQSKVKNMTRSQFQSTSDPSSQKNTGKSNDTLSYISIKDFKPILENYSSIKTLSPYDSKLSNANFYSTYHSDTSHKEESLQGRYQKISLTSKKKA